MAEAVVDKAHARRSPSGAKKRMLCPGSIVLEAGREDRPSRYAAEGTVAHTVMELCLTEGKDAEAFVGRVFEADGFEFEVDMAMADAVNEFLAHVQSFIDPAAGDVLLVEQQVPIGHITGEDGATGTADVVGITDGGTHLVVLDLKYGRGVRVLAQHPIDFGDDEHGHFEPNEQLCYYGLGALEEHGLLYGIERVTLGIGQPRLSHFDTVELTVGELLEQGKRLKRIETRCDSAEADALAPFFAERWLQPGEDQCRFCKGKAVCPALEAEVLGFESEASAATDFVDLTADDTVAQEALYAAGLTAPADETANERIARLMRRVPLIEAACLAIRAELEAAMFRGEAVDGFKLVQGKRGNRAWRDDVEVAELLRKSRLKTAEIFDEKLKSPAALEKAIAKDKPRVWAKVAELITQSEGKPSVAPESDKREALDLSARADDYVDLTVSDGSDLI